MMSPSPIYRACAVLAGVFAATAWFTASGQTEDSDLIELDPYVTEGFDLSSYSSNHSTMVLRDEIDHQQLPLLVNIVSHYLLDEQQSLDPVEGVKNISSVRRTVGSPGTGNQIVIRGFNTFSYQDGFRLGNSNSQGLEPISLPPEVAAISRIEVLKGPAAILYGRGLPGGVINFISKQPEDEFAGRIAFQVASYGHRKVVADLTAPLNNTVSYRLIASAVHSDSYREHVDQELYSVYPSVVWKPSERTTLLLQGEYREGFITPDRGSLFLPFPQPDGNLQPRLAPYSSQSAFYGDKQNRWDVSQRQVTLKAETSINELWTIGLLLGTRTFEKSGQEVRGSTFNSRGDVVLPVSLEDNRLLTFAEDYLIRFRHESDDRRDDFVVQLDNRLTFSHPVPLAKETTVQHRLLVSAEWQPNRVRSQERQFGFDQLNPANGETEHMTTTIDGDPIAIDALGPYQNDFSLDPVDAGVAVQDLITVGEKWHLLAGLRFERSVLDFSLLPALVPFTIEGGTEREEWLLRLGALYQFTPSVAFFINYGESYRPVLGVSGTGQFIFDAQLSDQYEAGLKLLLAEGRFQLNAAGFSVENENVLSRVGSDPLGNAVFGLLSQSVTGFEADLTARFSDRLTLLAHYGYLDTEVEGHPFIEGNRLSGTPEHAAGFWLNFDFVQSQERQVSASIGLNYEGTIFASDANQLELPSTTVLELGARYRHGPWQVRLNLTNVTDERYFIADDIEVIGDATSAIYALPAPPRSLRFSVEYRF